MLDHQEIADLRFQELAAALDERAVGLERLDQRQHAADILDARRAELLERIGGDHGADAALREELEQQRSRHATRDEVRAAHAAGERAHGVLERARRLGSDLALARQRIGLLRGELADHLVPAVDGQLVGK